MGSVMNIEDIKEYVTNQLKSYKVTSLMKEWTDEEFTSMYEQINQYKPWETERRLIDYARYELDKFRYVLYTERHYEDLLIDKACIDGLRYEDVVCAEKKYYVRRPQS
jgi:hypothetical protein